ncbi:MAG: hypothetical protein EHM68_06705 [Lysobacterales bacterium]|nr:MAG: hypothetical protein EHM68_06705 [Xanthomonadales bacterium]
MESSRRYLLQAEIEYWHEMLRLNRDRLTRTREKEMRDHLREAVHALNTGALNARTAAQYRAVA